NGAVNAGSPPQNKEGKGLRNGPPARRSRRELSPRPPHASGNPGQRRTITGPGGRHRAAGRRSVIGILAGVSALVAAIPTAAATGPFIDPFNSVQTIPPTVRQH